MKEQIIKALAEYFRIEADEDGNFDLDDRDWTCGCNFNGRWLCLRAVINCLEQEGII